MPIKRLLEYSQDSHRQRRRRRKPRLSPRRRRLFVEPLEARRLLVGDGILDPLFGSGGIVTTDLGSSNDVANDLAVQPDGKIVLGGYRDDGSQKNLVLTRYEPDGTPDAAFGTGGAAIVDVIGSGNDRITSVAIQEDGKIVAGGMTTVAGNDFQIARFNPDGSLDTTFGGNGLVSTQLSTSTDQIHSIVIQTNGRILAGGLASNLTDFDFSLVRYNTDGSLDTTFDGDGIVKTDFGNDLGAELALQADGKILLVGSSSNGGNERFAVVRYNVNGSLDGTFGTGGIVTTPIGPGNAAAKSVVVQPDGRIVVAGSASNGSDNEIAVVRYAADGSHDTTFDGDGIVRTNIGSSSDVAFSVGLQENGQIVVAGEAHTGSDRDFVAVRYHADGSLDTSFGGAGSGIVTTDISGANRDDSAFFAAVRTDGILVGGTSDNGSDIDFGLARYTLNRAPSFFRVSAQDKLTATTERLGASVAIDGDFAVVGSVKDSTVASQAGAAFIFRRDNNGTADETDDTWSQVAKLAPTSLLAGAEFGYAVAIDGDTLAVSARLHDQVANNTGAVYVYRNVGGSWEPEQLITPADGAADDIFGQAVDVSGDTLVIGSRQDDDGATNQGTAYVYARSGSTWSLVKKIRPGDPTSQAHRQFGHSVSIDGDTIAVGARWDAAQGSSAGAVYIFDRNHGGTDNWGQRHKRVASDGAANAEFGYAVSLQHDRLIVTARNATHSGVSEAGAAYVLERNAGGANNWGETQKLVADHPGVLDQFGFSVSLDGNRAVIGALGLDSAGANSGGAYLFEFADTQWTQKAKLIASGGQPSDGAGRGVAVAGKTILVGVTGDDDSGPNAGAAHVHLVEQSGISPTPQVIDEGQAVTLTGTFFDPDANDVHTVEVDWGDGNQQNVVLTVGERTFSIPHTYTDDNLSDQYTISAVITDDAGQSSDAVDAAVSVLNVAPAPTISGPAAVPLGNSVSLLAHPNDPGTEDTFTYDWVVTKDGNTFATGSSVSLDFTPDEEGLYEVGLTVTDDDGGAGMATATVASIVDFGDAPDSYLTTLASNGPRHKLLGPQLGDLRDGELDSPGSLDGFGDDLSPITGPDDEDGVEFTVLSPGAAATATVEITGGSGRLYAWFDFNADGDFADPGEQISAGSSLLTAGFHNINFTIPAGAATGTTFARFRVSTDVGLGSSGLAQDGEVEDYALQVTVDPAEIRGIKFEDLDGDGVQDAGESGLEGWTIYLDQNGNRMRDAGEIATTTAADGSYAFLSIPAGDYRVAEIPQAGWLQTFPDPEPPAPPKAPPSLTRTGSPVTAVSGRITGDTTWTVANAPYRATASITVDPGVTLTLEPGVEVLFDAGTGLTVQGGLRATGTSALPILFTSSAATPAAGDWSGLTIDADAGGTASLRFATLEFAQTALSLSGSVSISPVDVQDSSLRQSNVGLAGSGGVDILVVRSHFDQNTDAVTATDVRIFDSLFTDNTVALQQTARVHVVNGHFTGNGTAVRAGHDTIVQNSQIRGNNTGVEHDLAIGEAMLRNNDITENDIGVRFQSGSTDLLHGNNVFDNNTFNVENLSADAVDASNNYWGTVLSAVIGTGIHDQRDDPAKGIVTFKPFAFDLLPTGPTAVGTHEVVVAAAGLAAEINFGNRPKVSASFTAASQSVAENAGIVAVEAQLVEPLSVDTTMRVRLSGSGIFEKDYLLTDPNLFFEAGTTSATILISILDDERFENTDNLVLTLQEGDSVTPGAVPIQEILVSDDDPVPQVSFQTASQLVQEDVGTLAVTVRLSSESDSDVVVPLTFGGSADSTDFNVTGPQTVVIPGGSLYASTDLAIVDDSDPEGAEFISIGLGSITGGVVSVRPGDPITQTIIIRQNDEPSVFFSSSLRIVRETDAPFAVTARLSETSPLDITVPITVSAQSTASAADFTPVGQPLPQTQLDLATGSGQIFIPAGQLLGTLLLDPAQDSLFEPGGAERLLLQLGTPNNAVARTGQPFTALVRDTDRTYISFSSPGSTVWENHGLETVRVNASVPADQPLSIPLTFGGASLNSDYTSPDLSISSNQATLVIPQGSTFAEFDINVKNDPTPERFFESLYINIGDNVSPAYRSSPSQFRLVIKDNDPYVRLTGGGKVFEGFSRSLHVHLVDAAGYRVPSNQTVTAPILVGRGGRLTPSDYSISPSSSVTFLPGEKTKSIVVTAKNDNRDEHDEAVVVALRSNITNGTREEGSRPRGVTILDTDRPPQLRLSTDRSTAWEGDEIRVTVSLTKPSDQLVTVKVREAAGSSAESGDTNFNGRTVSFPRGETSRFFNILVEKNFDFSLWKRDRDDLKLELDNPNNATLPRWRSLRQETVHLRTTSRAKPQVPAPIPTPTTPVQASTVGTLAFDANAVGAVPDANVPAPVSIGGPGDPMPVGPILVHQGNGGFFVGGTAFFDSNFNGIADFLDLNGNGIQDSDEPSEPTVETAADGSFAIVIEEAFDLSGDGAIDASEGRVVLTGGTDAATLLPFVGQFAAVPGQFLLSSTSTVVSKLVAEGLTPIDARTRAIEAFALPAGIDLLTLQPEKSTINGEADGARLYATNAKLFDTTVQAASLFADVPGAAPIGVLIELAYAGIAEQIGSADSSFDPSLPSNVEGLLLGISFATGLELDAAVVADAAAVIAAGNEAIDAIPETTDLAYLQRIVRVEKVAQGTVATALQNAGAANSSGTLVSDYTGSNLDNLIAAAAIGNVMPPAIAISDVAQSENDAGQQVFEFTVALAHESAFPVSVAYTTDDESATAGEDYQATSGTLNWAAGDNSDRVIQVTVNADQDAEADELFVLGLFDPVNAVLKKQTGYGWILNDDGATHATSDNGSTNEIALLIDAETAELRDNDDQVWGGFYTNPLQLTINGHDNVDDRFTLDLTTNTYRADTITFHGGAGGSDAVEVLGGQFDTITHRLTNPTDGSTVFDAADSAAIITLNWTGLEPFLLDVGSVDDMVFELPAGATTAILEDPDPADADGTLEGMMQLRSPDGHFETTIFPNPTGSLTILRGDAADSITIASLDPAFAGALYVSPGLTVNQASISVVEGLTAHNGGTFTDPDGDDPVTLTASVGTVTDNNDGTWSWSFATSDGPDDSQTVTITATDSDGDATSTPFTLTVNNVAPTFEAGADETLLPAVEGLFNRSLSFTDPGADTWTGTVNFGEPGGVDQALTIDQSAKSFDLHHTYANEGTFTVTVTITDDDGGSHVDTLDVTVDLNSPPAITAQSFTIDENLTAAGTVTATDPDLPSDTLTFSITGAGPDDAQFSMLPGGTLSFTSAPDFENPTDVGGTAGDNIYVVQVKVEDAAGQSDLANISITVAPVNDNAPVFTSAAAVNVAENTTAVQTVTATDDDLPSQTVVFSLDGGADAAKFSLTAAGLLTFNTAPDFENPTDSGGDNVYDVIIKADDQNGLTTTQAVAVTVTPVNDNAPVFTSAAAVNVAENTTAVQTATATDDDLPSQTIVFSLDGGADAAKFSITPAGVLTFNTPPDFANPTDDDGNNVYETILLADDQNGLTTTQTILVTVIETDVNNAPSLSVSENVVTVNEGDSAANAGTFFDLDGSNLVTVSASVGTIAQDHGSSGDWLWSLDTRDSDQTQTVTITATDNHGAAASISFELVVANQAPTIASLVSSATLVNKSANGQVTIEGTFTDAGTTDTHEALVQWGDGSAPETVSLADLPGGSGTFSGGHQYSHGGIFTITVSLLDDDGGALEETTSAVVIGAGVIDGVLQIIGTPDRDRIQVDERSTQIRVRASLGREGRINRTFAAADVISILVLGCEGNDEITISNQSAMPAVVHAGGGHDRIRTGEGDDTIDGGAGDDDIKSNSGHDTIVDMAGRNRIWSGTGNDTVTTGDGRDRIWAGPGDDVVMTGSGNDEIRGESGHDTIDAGDGNNKVWAGDGNDLVITGSGNDWISGDKGHDIILAGAGDDDIAAGHGNDVVVGGDGDDSIAGGHGHDVLVGGGGRDRMRGGHGNDLMIAGSTANDSHLASLEAALAAWTSGDLARALASLGAIVADQDRDLLTGNQGRDKLIGSEDDVLRS